MNLYLSSPSVYYSVQDSRGQQLWLDSEDSCYPLLGIPFMFCMKLLYILIKLLN